MPPKVKYKRDDIVNAALAIVRRDGADAVNARAVAGELRCSTQPIFREFASMEQLMAEAAGKAAALYAGYIEAAEKKAEKPYLGTGMAYLRFAREEPQLFRLLFMCDRRKIGVPEDATIEGVISLVMEKTGYSRKRAELFHLHIWIYTHGLASMLATNYLSFSDEELSALLSEEYIALKERFDSESEDAEGEAE